MWCHLCCEAYPDFEDFRNHIIEKHQNASNFGKENSDSEHEQDETSDIDDENIELNALEGSCYESDHNLGTEIKSDDSMDGNDNIVTINTLPEQYNNISTEIKSDGSMDTDDNTEPLCILPDIIHDEEDKTSLIETTTLKKRRQQFKKETKSSIKASTSKNFETPSIVKKRGRKKPIKRSFSKKALPKHRKSAASCQEDSHEDSNDHSESSLNVEVNPQSVPSNLNNLPSVPSNLINLPSVPVNNYPQSVSNNNPVYIVNPYAGQGMNSYVLGNPAVQPPLYVVNPVAVQPTTSQSSKYFDFNSQNILKWLAKHKEICKNIRYPLPSALFNQIKNVHKAIFDRYCIASVCEEATAVLKVYEELDCMIHKHINSIN